MAIFESIDRFAKRVGLSSKYVRSIAHTLPHVMCGNACMICIEDAINTLRQHATMCVKRYMSKRTDAIVDTTPPTVDSGCQCEWAAAEPTAHATQ